MEQPFEALADRGAADQAKRLASQHYEKACSVETPRPPTCVGWCDWKRSRGGRFDRARSC
jgi:hypothetical protein